LIRKLTVTSNRSTLEQLKAIGALPGWDLAMGEFGQELGFHVVNPMLVGSWGGNLDTAESSGGPDLKSGDQAPDFWRSGMIYSQPCPCLGIRQSREFLQVPFLKIERIRWRRR
jgi:hypothetical protein